ncbi:Glycosyltransferase [Acidisarcina polymorpha]|uniref:Glycosyltransferase n=1 Tax=Acidisarcina polymorpha TaxID=2211140 RepID=A0A2Z5G4S4_9BACT|nr:glycosyltransferase family 1 protein [Acidisarcina polymorpha]AXC13747.1 Glycosyltransferase [Acidisarcina polymorpha]
MKIAIMTESFLPKVDGIVTMLTKTVECLRQSGDEVIIFAPSGGPSEIFGAEVVAMPSLAFPLYPELRLALPRTSMRQKLRAFQPDILHLFEPALLGVGGIYYSQELHIPLVVSYHTNLPAYLGYYKLGAIEGLTWKLMRERHRRASLNLCTSTAMIDDLGNHGVGQLALWERAVDANRFRPGAGTSEMRIRLSGGYPAAPLLLYVGRLSAEKDVALLKDLFSVIPEMRLAIVGDGPLRPELERQFEHTATVFTGYLKGDQLASAYASADLFVLPSQTETLGLVLLESMASGCPVIACRAGGVPDAVQDGKTGFLFDPDDRDSFAATVRKAYYSNGQLTAIRANARRDVELHSWISATAKLRELYCQVVREGPKKISKGPVPLPRRIAAGIARGTLRTLLP